MSDNKKAIFLIIISVLCGTLMLTFLKLAQEDVNVYVAGFFRFFFGLLIIFPYILKSKLTVFKTNHHKKHFLRAFLNLPSMLLYFSALVMMPIEKATAISFVVPFLVTILAVLWFYGPGPLRTLGPLYSLVSTLSDLRIIVLCPLVLHRSAVNG